jgi:hypothetical protein
LIGSLRFCCCFGSFDHLKDLAHRAVEPGEEELPTLSLESLLHRKLRSHAGGVKERHIRCIENHFAIGIVQQPQELGLEGLAVTQVELQRFRKADYGDPLILSSNQLHRSGLHQSGSNLPLSV